jgi:predicted nucleic acid-binding protein
VRIYVDTSGLYAYVCKDDQDHSRVLPVFHDVARRRERLVATSYVLCETMGLIQHRLGVKALRSFVEGIVPLLEVVWVGAEDHAAAWSLMRDRPKRALTLVDAAGVVVMRREGLKRCIALDPEFRREGFEVLPGSQ